jgi:hypothetical protein
LAPKLGLCGPRISDEPPAHHPWAGACRTPTALIRATYGPWRQRATTWPIRRSTAALFRREEGVTNLYQNMTEGGRYPAGWETSAIARKWRCPPRPTTSCQWLQSGRRMPSSYAGQQHLSATSVHETPVSQSSSKGCNSLRRSM